MAKKEFTPTPSQENAINAPIMDLLVSAAAGSGKTAVLSRRILRMICDPDEPVLLSKMLVVTFTKAAAEELKMRIGKELKKALAALRFDEEAANGDKWKREEQLMTALTELESAEISTIHSFCYALIRKNFSSLGLSPSLRIADDAETKLLKIRVMEETIDSQYENDPDFSFFAEQLVTLRDNTLSESLLEFYENFIALPEGPESLLAAAERFGQAAKNFAASPYTAVLKKALTSFFDYYRTVFDRCLKILEEDEKGAAYLSAFAKDKDYIASYSSVKDDDFFSLFAFLSKHTFEGLKGYPNPKPAEILWASSMRDSFKKGLKSFREKIFLYTEAECCRDALSTAAFSEEMYRVLTAFDKAYTAEKASYGILDFSDLERYAYRLLVKDGKPTELAASVAKRYDAVFIDEYQDTNDLQDAIFSSIARHNRFMVGDIKQSIYGFRGAVPELFSRYRDRFPPYQKGAGQKEATIFLSDNFRCDEGVIRFSNAVFDKLFHNNSGRVPYLDEDALVYGKAKAEDAGLETKLILVNKEDLSEAEAVAKEVAAKVQAGVKPKDIVILLRSMKHADAYKKALAVYALKGQCAAGDDTLFSRPEVLLLIALLNVIDNPTRDIYLAAVLKSPIFDFSLGELCELRASYPALSLYSTLLDYREHDDRKDVGLADKINAFFEFLEKARRYAEMQTSDRVIRYLFSTTSLRAIATKASGSCRALTSFYEYARCYEAESFRGVHALCHLVREVEADDANKQPKYSEKLDLSGIRLMTIHASKGCEFDYVFLPGLSGKFNDKDETKALLYEKDLGIALRLREKDSLVRYDTLLRRALSQKIRENRYDEEMRILYVALTRAKKQLILSAVVKDRQAAEKFLEPIEPCHHPYLYTHCLNYRDMIRNACPTAIWSLASPNETTVVSQESESDMTDRHLTEELKKRLAFVYPHEALLTLPTKLSVSRLYPEILDDTAASLIRSERADFDSVPLFMQEETEVSAAERGTATHLFMQFCDFDHVVKQGIDAEIERLREKRFITEKIASLVDRNRLAVFFESALFARMRSAKQLLREERFNVRMNAADFTQEEEKKKLFADETLLIQGVVDCMLREEDGSIVLIDYKTDHTPKDRQKAEQLLRERYTDQLSYYRIALEAIYHTRVKEMLLYSFSLGDTVTIL